MEILNTIQILEKLKINEPDGLEVTLCMGILSTTKCIYFRKGLVYIFLMEQKFTFNKEAGMTEEYFLNKHLKWMWEVEQIIS
jgi:hypothetical protein